MKYLYVINIIMIIVIIICLVVALLFKKALELKNRIECQKEEILSPQDPISDGMRHIEELKAKLESMEIKIKRLENNKK